MFENEKSQGGWRFHNDLHNFYFSPVIIWLLKSRKMTQRRCVARMVETRDICKMQVGKPQKRAPLLMYRRT